jgi:ribonuclease HI
MPRAANTLFPDDNAAPPLSANWVLAHCDGGARGNPGPAGYGAVLTDASGKILAELSEFLGNRTNNFAEYSGLLGCLQWALDNHHPRLRVTSDSELMVKQIQGKYKVNSPDLRPLWEEARRRIAQLDRFEITHALRHKNKDADRLANDAMDRGTGKPAAGRPTHPPSVLSTGAAGVGERPAAAANPKPAPAMLRGFTRDGAIHLLGSTTLPDGIFVKVIPE